jgi:hypothetical protein
MFMSRQTFWALRQTTYAFIGMCKHYLPKAPEGCGIRASRCSQDPVERFFVRTKVLRPSASIDTTHDATAFAISDGVAPSSFSTPATPRVISCCVLPCHRWTRVWRLLGATVAAPDGWASCCAPVSPGRPLFFGGIVSASPGPNQQFLTDGRGVCKHDVPGRALTGSWLYPAEIMSSGPRQSMTVDLE